MNVTNNDAQKALDNFLVGNDDLEQLNARLASFNLFSVLRIERAEIRHSNVLAWLLTPGESHGFGDAFLRRYISTLLMENGFPDVSLTAAKAELMTFRDVEVMREWNNIDILVVSRSEKWFLLIENKIGSKESSHQLEKCQKKASTAFPFCQELLVLLTVDGNEPSEQAQNLGYVAATHGQVLEIAESLRRQHENRIPEDAKVFLDHYLEVLRRVTMQDDEIVQLCKRIYRRHRAAIDLIVEYGATSQVIDVCDETINSLVKCEFSRASSGMFRFLPMELGQHLPLVELNAWNDLPRATPIVWFFLLNKKLRRLRLICEVGPITDHKLRVRLLDAIKQAGFTFNESTAYKESARYTRILGKTKRLRANEGDETPENIANVVTELWANFAEDHKKLVSLASQFNW